MKLAIAMGVLAVLIAFSQGTFHNHHGKGDHYSQKLKSSSHGKVYKYAYIKSSYTKGDGKHDDDDKGGDGKHGDGKYGDSKYRYVKYGDGKYRYVKYGDGKHGDGKYGDGKHDDDDRGGDGKHGDGKYGDGKYGDGKHGDGKYGDGKHGDGKYGDGKHGDGKYGDGKHGDGKYGDGKHGDGKYGDDDDRGGNDDGRGKGSGSLHCDGKLIFKTCESWSFKRKKYSYEGGKVKFIRVYRSLSKYPCQAGKSWGFDSKSIWVDKLCRAKFAICLEEKTGCDAKKNPCLPGYKCEDSKSKGYCCIPDKSYYR